MEWRHFKDGPSCLFFVVDLSVINPELLDGNRASFHLDPQIATFSQLYHDPQFCDRTRSRSTNPPIFIIFVNSNNLHFAWQTCDLTKQWPGYKNGDNFNKAKADIINLFMSVQDKDPKPRVLYPFFLPAIHKPAVLELEKNLSTHLQSSPAIEYDKIIRGIIMRKGDSFLCSQPSLMKKNSGREKSSTSTISKKELACIFEQLEASKKAKLINLRNQNLRFSELEPMISIFSSNSKCIASLNLSSNPLGDDLLISILSSLELQKNLCSLILIDVGMSRKSCPSMSRLICSTNSLKILDISENYIRDEGCIMIAEALLSNNTVETLEMYNCGFGNPSAPSLSAVLRSNICLKRLFFEKNYLDSDGSNHILHGLRSNTFSSVVQLKFNSLSIANLNEAFEMALAKNISITNRKKRNETDDVKEFFGDFFEKNKSIVLQNKTMDIRCLELSNKISPLFKSFKEFSGINSLLLGGNSLRKFPSGLRQLAIELTELYLESNNLTTLPESMGNLVNLRVLSLPNNRISSLPLTLRSCRHLWFLDLRWNRLGSIPDCIFELGQLRTLWLQKNLINYIPSDIFDLTNLSDLSVNLNLIHPVKELMYRSWSLSIRCLDLSGRGLNCLPNEIGFLSTLVDLLLADNQISTLPSAMSHLSLLRRLSLANNKIDSLAPIRKLDLRSLDITGNPLSLYPKEILTMTTEKIIKTVNETHREKIIQLYRSKLMVVGSESVGKTTLISQLINVQSGKQKKKKKSSTQMEKLQPTVGIDISHWTSNTSPPIKFSIWDFAGHETYHATHSFFLAPRSVFLVVFNLSDFKNELSKLEYWLKTIKSSSERSPVILVGTHLDRVSDDFLATCLQKINDRLGSKFPNVKKFVPLTTFDPSSVETLREEIINVTSEQSFMGQKVSTGYEELEAQIINERQIADPPIISMKDFERMVMSAGIDSSGQTAAEFLNECGVIAYFNDKKLGVSNNIVLDPQWLVRIISTVICAKPNDAINNGILYHKDLSKFWGNYKESFYSFLMSIFNRMELAYTFQEYDKDNGKYSVIPSMLPSQRPKIEGRWIPLDDYLYVGNGSQLERIYLFELLPFGFFSRLIVRTLHYASPVYFWKTGMIVEKGPDSALIVFEPITMELSVSVRGVAPAKLLRTIVESIDLLIVGWYNIKAEVVVPFVLKGKEVALEVQPQFPLAELEKAAAFGKEVVSFEGRYEVRIDSIAPDLVLADLKNMMINHEELKRHGSEVGRGGFGAVFKATRNNEVFAVKEMTEIENEHRVEAFREFRREVALSV